MHRILFGILFSCTLLLVPAIQAQHVPADRQAALTLQGQVTEMEQRLEDLHTGLLNLVPAQACAMFSPDFSGSTPFDPSGPLKTSGIFEIGSRVEGSGSPAERAAQFFNEISNITGCEVHIADPSLKTNLSRSSDLLWRATLHCEIETLDAVGRPSGFEDTFEADLCGYTITSMRRTHSRVTRATRRIFSEWPIPDPRHFLQSTEVSMGGLALGDYDGDGRVDMFLPRLGRGLLLHNEGKSFSIQELGPVRAATGALFLDYDNDGKLDLLITAMCDGHDGCPGCGITLLRNKGDGTFEDVTAKAHLTTRGQCFSACAADIDGDGNLDIFVKRFRSGRQDAPSTDATWNSEPDLLFRNNGDGTFTEIAQSAGVAQSGWGFSCVFSDLNGDGLPDLCVASDRDLPAIYLNRGGCRFEAVHSPGSGFPMGIAIGDADGDGRPDLFFTRMYSTNGNQVFYLKDLDKRIRASLVQAAQPGILLKGDGQGRFSQKIAGVEYGGWGWGAQFVDIDNDGRPDLHVTNGLVNGSSHFDS